MPIWIWNHDISFFVVYPVLHRASPVGPMLFCIIPVIALLVIIPGANLYIKNNNSMPIFIWIMCFKQNLRTLTLFHCQWCQTCTKKNSFQFLSFTDQCVSVFSSLISPIIIVWLTLSGLANQQQLFENATFYLIRFYLMISPYGCLPHLHLPYGFPNSILIRNVLPCNNFPYNSLITLFW